MSISDESMAIVEAMSARLLALMWWEDQMALSNLDMMFDEEEEEYG